jgi:hypothetical protein
VSDIISDVVPDTVPDVYFFQVERLVRLLKHKLIPENAYHKEHNFDFILSAPNEELHQFLINLYGDHLLPATKHEIEKCLRGPDTIKSFNKKKEPKYIISKKMLRGVWKRLQDRLASVDSCTSTIEITSIVEADRMERTARGSSGASPSRLQLTQRFAHS